MILHATIAECCFCASDVNKTIVHRHFLSSKLCKRHCLSFLKPLSRLNTKIIITNLLFYCTATTIIVVNHHEYSHVCFLEIVCLLWTSACRLLNLFAAMAHAQLYHKNFGPNPHGSVNGLYCPLFRSSKDYIDLHWTLLSEMIHVVWAFS